MKILAVDIGGTFIKYAVINDSVKFFQRGKIPTPKGTRAEFFNTIEEIFKSVEVSGIALSMPGIIDAERGICIKSNAFSYNNGVNVAKVLENICNVKVTVENDANCAAFAEAKSGSLTDVEDGFVMIFGTSIGSAFIKGGDIHRGKNNLAGEVAFTFLEGKIFESYCSVPALLKDYAQVKNLSTENINGKDFFKAVEEKENDALACLDKFTRQIAYQLFNIQMLLDPEKFAIGGGISAQDSFINSIRANLEKIYAASPVEFPRVKVVPCKFRNDANLIGALFRWLSN